MDPSTPSITAWDLRDGEYVVVGSATGEEKCRLQQPYGVELVLARLLD